MKFLQTVLTRLRSAPRKQRIFAGLSVAAALLAWLLFHPSRPDPLTQNSFYTAKKSDFLVSIVEGGTLKAVHEVTVRSELEGVARIIAIVPEGTNVHKGDLLVELDSSELRDRMTAQEVVVQNSDFAHVQAKENLSIQKSLVESNIKDGELKVEFAKSDLSKYLEGDWPQAQKDAQAKITIAKVELERAKDRLNWSAELQKKGYATKSELEADSLTVTRKEIELSQAEEQLKILTKYDYPKRKRLLEANVEQAEKELERLKQRSAAQIAQVEASVKSQSATLDLHQKRLADLREQLTLTKIVAPQDGLVVYASSSSPGMGILIEEGATVRQKQEIIKLPDISQMMVEVRVHESHVQKLKPGLEARVMIDSIPDQQFIGEVRKIAVLPDSSSRFFNPNLKVYTTEVVIHDDLPDLKPGISARAEIIITNLSDVITVPIQAVTTVKGNQVCLIKNGNATKPVSVEVGLYSDRYIEVKSGISEGDQVLLSAMSSSDNIDLSGSIVANEDTNANNRANSRKGHTNRAIEKNLEAPARSRSGAHSGPTNLVALLPASTNLALPFRK